jgi:diguanylate cyclase (GGDEF)-like protein/PAS domain S-box-containing protein
VASTVIPLRQSAVEPSLKQAAFDHLPVPALCLNASGQVLAANAAALRERNGGDLVGKHLSEIVAYAPRHAARRWARLWMRLQAQGQVHLIAHVPLADGRRPVLAIDAQLMRFEQDSVAALLLHDVSERHLAQREQKRQQARLIALLGAADGLAVLIGADRRVAAVHAFSALPQDLALTDVLGVPFELLLDEPSSAEFLAAIEGSASDQASFLWRLRPRGTGAGAGAASATGANAGRWLSVTLLDRRSHPLIRSIVLHARDATALLEARALAERLERRVRAFADSTSDVLMLLDAEGQVRYQAPAIRQSLGIAPEATLGQPALAMVLAEDRPRLRATIESAALDNTPRAHHCLVRVPTPGGGMRRLWLAVHNYQKEPSIGGLLASGHDVTRVLRDAGSDASTHGSDAERRLEFRERLLELAMQTRGEFTQSLSRLLRTTAGTLDVTAASFWRLDPTPRRLQCEAWFDAHSERFAREWIGIERAPGVGATDVERLLERQTVCATDTRSPLLATRYRDDPRWLSLQAALEVPVLLSGDVVGVLSIHHALPRTWDEDEINFSATAALMTALAMEAAQRQEAEGRIEQLAWYDSLTGLPNRNLLRETMRDMIMTAANRRRRIAVMLIDLDRFKDVNDTLGHLVGDALIKSAAAVLKDTVGTVGVVARLGGDEFVVLVNEFEHRQEVALLAARIAQALHRTDLVPNVDTQVSASIGVALFPEHGREMSTLLKNADAAMYQAKRDGRNQFSFFNPIRYERATREVQLGIQLLKAVQSDSAQFVVYYQPQIEMASGRVVGLEALIRWQHPTFGLLTPDRFIGVAEVSGLSERITRWVVNEVCAQVVRWRQSLATFDIPIAVNVAGREMGSATLPMLVRSCLQRHAVEPRMLTLEITERTLVRENEINNDVMTELAALGVGLVLDDFGTGYSMLGYLKRMPIQALKIDQSFIEGIPEDPDSRAIVHAMLAVARHFKLKVVAEGIESAEQGEYLRSIGCEYAQGYFYARPLPAQTILDHVHRDQPAA